MNITSKTDEEIVSIADPIWENLTQGSNEINYKKFSRHFSRAMLTSVPEEELKRQFEINHREVGLISSERKFIGCIRREAAITVLWKGHFTIGKGERLAQITLGEEDGEIKVLGAFIG